MAHELVTLVQNVFTPKPTDTSCVLDISGIFRNHLKLSILKIALDLLPQTQASSRVSFLLCITTLCPPPVGKPETPDHPLLQPPPVQHC